MVHIDLDGNSLQHFESNDLFEFLTSNPSLRRLKLWGIYFTDQNIVWAARTLRHDSNLRYILLSGDRNSWIGQDYVNHNDWDPLSRMEFDKSSLNAVHASKHLCQIDISHCKSRELGTEKWNSYNDPKLNRRKKLYCMLSEMNSGNSTVHKLVSEGIRTNHLPQLLSIVKSLSEHYVEEESGIPDTIKVEPLLIVHEILLGWQMVV